VIPALTLGVGACLFLAAVAGPDNPTAHMVYAFDPPARWAADRPWMGALGGAGVAFGVAWLWIGVLGRLGRLR
jgi:hypothetical protein